MKKILFALGMSLTFSLPALAETIAFEDAQGDVYFETDPQEQADYTIMDTADEGSEFVPEVLRHVVGIYNKSSYDVYFGYTWDKDKVDYQFNTVKKGRCFWRGIKNDEKDDWRMSVQFDFDMGPDAQFKFYSLRSKKTHHLTCEDGMRYVFKDMKNRDKKIMLYKMK